MFRRLLQKFFKPAPQTEDPLTALDRELLREPSEHDVTCLYPVVVPQNLIRPDWPGQILPLGDLPFALTWAIKKEPHTFLYISPRMQSYWEGLGLDWKAQALQNLTQLAQNRRASGEKLDEDGKPFIKVILTDDSLGTSRLLIPHLFDDVFGSDYLVAIPEQTCAVAYRADLTPEQKRLVDGFINDCFAEGTEPMSPERFDPQRFWVL